MPTSTVIAHRPVTNHIVPVDRRSFTDGGAHPLLIEPRYHSRTLSTDRNQIISVCQPRSAASVTKRSRQSAPR